MEHAGTDRQCTMPADKRTGPTTQMKITTARRPLY
jgi:hypothetical protein